LCVFTPQLFVLFKVIVVKLGLNHVTNISLL
jgi:hypothetical protein